MEIKSPFRTKGFTVIELLIAIVIVGILAIVIVPNVQRYLLKSHRTDGFEALSNIQLAQEKYRSTHTTYATLAQLFGAVTASPNGYYALGITNQTATGYIATATAQGSQASDSQSGTSCAVLTLTVNGINTSKTPQACWGR